VIQLLRSTPGVSLVAVCDTSAEVLASLDLPESVGRFTSIEALLAAGPPELVAITTNGPSHAALAAAVLAAGCRRLLVEKPMGCSLAECDAMLAGAGKVGARLAVDQMRRVDPTYRWLREQIAAGTWGALRLVSVQRPGIGLGCLATHSFDLVRFLAGDRPVQRVTAWVDPFIGPNPRGARYVDPGGLVVMELEGGARAVIAQIEDGAGPMSVEIDLTFGRIRIDEKAGEVEIIARDPSVKPGPGRPPAYARVAVPDEARSSFQLLAQVGVVLAELAGEGPLACDGEHGRHAVEVLAAAHLSATRGSSPVALPLQGEDRALWMPVT
jgi:predicted dehydrogenase